MSHEPASGFSVTQHTLCPVCEKIVEESQPHAIRDGQPMHVACAVADDMNYGEQEYHYDDDDGF